jgi:hypothetical protein
MASLKGAKVVPSDGIPPVKRSPLSGLITGGWPAEDVEKVQERYGR